MRWVEMKCKCEVWSAGCEECSAKSEESAHLALHCTGARRSCSTAWLSMSNLTGLLAALHCLFKAWYNAFGRGAVMCNHGPTCSLPQLTTTSHDIATIQTQHGQHPKVRLSQKLHELLIRLIIQLLIWFLAEIPIVLSEILFNTIKFIFFLLKLGVSDG